MKKRNNTQPNSPVTSTETKVSLWKIFATFFKTGLFTFGGGYAMISLLEEDLVTNKQWLTSEDMLDMLVIAESTPGVIAVNTATSVGYRLRGILGALMATLGVVLPSFVIITALSFAVNAFQDNLWYQAAFTGIQACVSVLVLNAFVKMSRQVERSWFSVVLILASFAVALFTNFNVIYVILIGAALGVAYSLIAEAIANKKNKSLPLTESARLDETSDEQGEQQSQDFDGGDEQ